MTPPTSLARIKALCERYYLHPHKALGQHFLIEQNVLESILRSAHLNPSDTVLEIGPGLGVLTTALAPCVAHVIAIELDKHIIPALKEVLAPYHNVTIIQGDILTIPPTSYLLPTTSYKIVANIPYDITGKILRKFLSHAPLPTSLTLMMQYEVAKRIMAKPGDMSILALAVRYAGVPTLVQKVSPQAFWPMPGVSSAIITIVPYAVPRTCPQEPLFTLIKQGFSQKRKQLSTTLRDVLEISKEELAQLLTTLNLNARARPQDLSLEDWERLTKACLARQNFVENKT